jgi:hypothetical protein
MGELHGNTSRKENGTWDVVVAGTGQIRASTNTYPKKPLMLCPNNQASGRLVKNTGGRAPTPTTPLGSRAAAQTEKHTIYRKPG